MGKADILKEMIPLSSEDCFLIKQRTKKRFDFPLHIHREFELNYLENAKGALRIVGDAMEKIEDLDLVLIAGGVRHAFSNSDCSCNQVFQITIQFNASIFDSLLDKRLFRSVKEMFEKAAGGLVFGQEQIVDIQSKLKSLSSESNPDSFSSLLRLIDILKSLSMDQSAKILNPVYSIKENQNLSHDTDRLKRIMDYLHANYYKRITLSELADLISMSEPSLVRFFKKWTGKTFVDNLNEIRVENAICRLVDTTDSISEICYKCGFNNLSNFNRIFKKMQQMTPSVYREKFTKTKIKL